MIPQAADIEQKCRQRYYYYDVCLPPGPLGCLLQPPFEQDGLRGRAPGTARMALGRQAGR